MASTGNVCVEIISTNNVVDGRAIVYTDLCGNYQYLDRRVGSPLQTETINDKLVGRMDNNTYYTA